GLRRLLREALFPQRRLLAGGLLHRADPVAPGQVRDRPAGPGQGYPQVCGAAVQPPGRRSEEHTSELQSPCNLVCRPLLEKKKRRITSSKRPAMSSASLILRIRIVTSTASGVGDAL